MIDVGPDHFLINAITSAEDLDLILQTYTVCTSDDVLRNNVDIGTKPLLIYGTEKRNTMCGRKLKSKYKDSGVVYKEDNINFVTSDTLQQFTSAALIRIKNGEADNEEEDNKEFEEELEEEEREETKEIQVEEAPSIEPEEGDDKLKIKPKKIEEGGGLCQYGVPKLKVEYHSPNVMGLEESLFVNVSEDDLSNFFVKIKNKVITNIENDE